MGPGCEGDMFGGLCENCVFSIISVKLKKQKTRGKQ